MMSKKYGVGIVGAGWVAAEYVKVFRDHPLTEVIGIYNKTPGKATRLMQEHGVKAKEFASFDELLKDDRIRIMVHCAHADSRADYCARAAATGRHLVVEKPMATSRQEVDKLREAVTKAGVKTVCSVVLRWNPQFQTIKALLDDGKLGKLMYAEADYWHPIVKAYPGYPYYIQKISGGSAFTMGGIHAVDILRWLAGDVVEVAAFSAGPIANPDFQYPPLTVASLRFANGAIGKLSCMVEGETTYIFNTQLFGTDMSIRGNAVHSSKWYPGTTGYWTFPTVTPDSGDVAHHPFKPEIAHFMECIENNVESHAAVHDTYKSMALCFAIDESAAKGGQPVKVKLD
jgi:UDP-N-acetyl-2-amino-2-deoxyglucuronate dehydrogenase